MKLNATNSFRIVSKVRLCFKYTHCFLDKVAYNARGSLRKCFLDTYNLYHHNPSAVISVSFRLLPAHSFLISDELPLELKSQKYRRKFDSESDLSIAEIV